MENYISPYKDHNKYKNQYCEKVAQNGGKKAVSKYVDLESKIKQEFANKHHEQFYTLSDNEDSIKTLFSLFNLWRK